MARGGGDGHNKRRRISHDQLLPSGNIRGAFELHNLLRFKQRPGPEVKAGIDEFRNFCAEIAVNDSRGGERDVQLKVLKQYCDEQCSGHGEERDFSDLLSTWTLAVQNNNDDGILAAVPAALTQFFRTISSELAFRDFGLSLCQTLLKREQLQLIDRGLSAPKSKAPLATSCLELLSEIVSFDGGAVVGAVFSRRDFVLKRFDTLLEPSSREQGGGGGDHQRKSVRSLALRFLLQLLKYLDSDSKEELISQARLLHACIKGLASDSPDLVGDVLVSLRKWILDDADVSRDSKKKFFNSNNLGLFAQLYDYDDGQQSVDAMDVVDTEKETETRPVRDAVHDFLIYACTSPNGIAIAQTGWYPKEFNAEFSSTANSDTIDLGLESPYYSDDYSGSVPIKNSILAAFLQKLNINKDSLQAELAVRVFEHVPELVADYFCKKPKCLGPPKDTAEWRGQFAFIFSVINLPVPNNCGWHMTLPSTPPPLSVVMESIFPRQLDRVTLNQCLKSEDEVVVISAAKILIAIENKLGKVLGLFKEGNSKLWKQGARILRDMIAPRRPNIAEVVAAVQRADGDDEVHVYVREALFQYMATCSDGSISYDVGPAVQRTLALLADDDTAEKVRVSLTRQLASLMKVAGSAKSTRWTAFVQLLAHAATHDELKAPAGAYLMPKLLEKAVLREEKAFWALATALGNARSSSSSSSSSSTSMAVVQSLDNCIGRVSKQPVKYFDLSNGDVSLLASCVCEQWPYLTDATASVEVGLFAAEFLARLEAVGESVAVLDSLRQVFSSNARVMKNVEKWKRQTPEIAASTVSSTSEQVSAATVSAATGATPTRTTTKRAALDLSTIFDPVQPIPTSLSKLTTWSANPDFESELQKPASSRLASMLLLLSSPISEFRLHAHATLAKLTHILSQPTCTYSERTSLHLLLGEVNETFRSFSLAATATATATATANATKAAVPLPLPTIIPSLAIFLLSIITNPADAMYSTANRFLLRSPSWTPLTRLLPHWTNIILLREPEDSQTTDSDDATAPFVRVSRWLSVLISGLRTDQDLDLYRKAGVFERVCSLYLAPSTRREARFKILELVHAGATVRPVDDLDKSGGGGGGGGVKPSSKGADTLITRVGIRAWLTVVKSRAAQARARARLREGRDSGSDESLESRVVEEVERVLEANKDAEYIDKWEVSRREISKQASSYL